MPTTYVDRGGTFTDVVVVHDDGQVQVSKVPSDRAVVGDLAVGPLTFGTTVATNALLERTGVPTLLVVTRGLRDVVHIGDMTRPALFDPDARWPEPLCCRVAEVSGRIAADGTELEALDADALDLSGVEAVAIVLLHGPRNPKHELRLAELITMRAPQLRVALGHRVDPELGLLARIETTLVEAAIRPVLAASMARDRIPLGALAMRSDGSVCAAEDLAACDAVLSGPSGGVLAVAEVARQGGFSHAVGFDMGGTSTDVCRIDLPELPRRSGATRVAGVRVRRPMLEVHTIAAGGGSILWSDGLRLGVGPRSAGADPGPQCAGRGGPPTLTDAALAAGLVDAASFTPPLDPHQIELPADPEAFLDIARAQMAAAIRTLAMERGVDLDDHALVAFGGAAGQHAAGVADRLGIRTVLVHPCAAVLSAWGQSLARREEQGVKALWRPLDEPGWQAVEQGWRGLAEQLPALEHTRRTVELRHRGTDHPIEVEATTLDDARTRFDAQHRERFGFDRDQPIEVVNVRVRVRDWAPEPPRSDADPWGLGGRQVTGPVRLDSGTTSVAVPEGWTARRCDGLLRLDRPAPPAPQSLGGRTPLGVALWASRFMAVARDAGATLQRLSRSVNIRERLDFSCALFDGRGHLVANAPHIPVHLGAMGATVRDLLRVVPQPEPHQAYLCNAPDAGGSHLPDLTVVTPVLAEGQGFFVACRAHHVDVGGTTPGSMPPGSQRLADEGFVVRHLPLLQRGRLRSDLHAHLQGCRELDTVRADLEAQVACNAQAATHLANLGPPDRVAAWMAHLQDVAAESVRARLTHWPAGRLEARDPIDGLDLVVTLERLDDARLRIDFTGTGGPHVGNLNAPRAVVRAAVLYALRVLVGRDIPLNDGALRPVELVIPRPSVLDPPSDAAVAGGNVETSQRLVDCILRAAGHMAASAGSMSNLTLGGEGWSLYETVGGGEGASHRGPGASGRQVHMTNTRATDPEVLEARLPLRLRRFAFRDGSGGHGRHRGGAGLVRELEVTGPATAALLATRRDIGAPGLGDGSRGVPGRDSVVRAGVETPWSGEPVDLAPGDRVIVRTPGGGGWTSGDGRKI